MCKKIEEKDEYSSLFIVFQLCIARALYYSLHFVSVCVRLGCRIPMSIADEIPNRQTKEKKTQDFFFICLLQLSEYPERERE